MKIKLGFTDINPGMKRDEKILLVPMVIPIEIIVSTKCN